MTSVISIAAFAIIAPCAIHLVDAFARPSTAGVGFGALVVVITADGVGNELAVGDRIAGIIGAWVEVLAGFGITAQAGAVTASVSQGADIVVIARFGVVGKNTALDRVAGVVGAEICILTIG